MENKLLNMNKDAQKIIDVATLITAVAGSITAVVLAYQSVKELIPPPKVETDGE